MQTAQFNSNYIMKYSQSYTVINHSIFLSETHEKDEHKAQFKVSKERIKES